MIKDTSEMLTEIHNRVQYMQQRLTQLEWQIGIASPRPPKRFVKGITDA